MGRTATGSVISQGAYQDIWNGTVNNATLIGNQQVLAGGVANGTLIILGGHQYVGSGGTTNGTIITANGLQYVDAGATANGTAMNSGGFQYVKGTASDTTVNGGGTQAIEGTSFNATIASGGTQNVLLGGTVSGTIVEAGGYQSVAGTIDGTTLTGFLQILAGGSSTNTAIASGGAAFIGSGGSATDTTVSAGGLLYVGAGGLVTDTAINGGFQFVAGTANGTTVNSGEMDVAGAAYGTHLSGGVTHVLGGGTQNGVNFAGSAATLLLDNPAGLTGTVSNFELGDTIDFLNLSVNSFSFDGSTLTLVTGGGNLNYQFAGTEAGTAMNVVSDGHGGTSVSLSLLSQFSASLVPDAGEGAIAPQGSDPQSNPLVHAQS